MTLFVYLNKRYIKPKDEIINGQSRDADSIEHTMHRRWTSRTEKPKKMSKFAFSSVVFHNHIHRVIQ